MKTHQIILFSTALIFSLTALSAPAAVMVFTYSGAGSGTLNGVPFSNVAFVITGRGNMPVDFAGGRSTDHDSASIVMQGLGTFDFLSETRTFVNNSNGRVGFSRAGSDESDLFQGPFSEFFFTWNMETDLAEISGEGRLLQWDSPSVVTSAGLLFFSDSSPLATFSAAAVPEPSGTVLLCCGASVLLMRRHRLTPSNPGPPAAGGTTGRESNFLATEWPVGPT